MSLTHLNVLAQLPAAEQHLIGSIDAVTSTLNTIGTTALDAALARLEEATRGVHGRLGVAMGALNNKIAGVVDALEGLGTGILEELSTDAHLGRHGSDHRTVEPTIPAQIAEALDPTPDEIRHREDEEWHDEADKAPGDVVIDPATEMPPATEPETADQTMARVLLSPTAQSHQQARQDARAVESARQPSTVPNARPDQPQALADLASMPEVSRMVCCVHNGPGAYACQACRRTADLFTAPTTAANAPVANGRDDRQTTTRRKPRRKSTAST